MLIEKTATGDIGEYRVKVYGILDNYSGTEESVEFNIEVVDAVVPPILEFLPEWYPKFVN